MDIRNYLENKEGLGSPKSWKLGIFSRTIVAGREGASGLQEVLRWRNSWKDRLAGGHKRFGDKRIAAEVE